MASAVAALLCAAGPVAAQEGPALEGATRVPIESTVLDNGLEVIVSTDRSAPLVAVNLWYGVGSGHEPEGHTGFAHLFEHLAFEATETLAAGELKRMISGTGGAVGGRTTVDHTEYAELVPSHHLNRVIWSHAERMRRLVVSAEAFERQRQIVKEERRLRVENAPYGEAQITVDTLAQAYAPYRHSVIGGMADLDAASVDDVRAFYNRWYRPNNARLVIVGDASMEEVLPWVERYLGGFEPGPAPVPLSAPPSVPRTDGPRRAELVDPLAQLPLAYVAWTAPPEGHADLPALQVANQLLSAGEASRLARRLVDERGLATQVVGQLATRFGPGLFLTGALAAPGMDTDEVERTLSEVVQELADQGPTVEEVARAVNQLRVTRAAELLTVAGRASAIQRAATFEGDPGAVRAELEHLLEVTPEQVRAAVARWLTEGNRTVVVARPAGGDE